MPRTRKGAGKGRQSQAVKSANADVKAIQKQSREILRRAGLNLREFRKEVSALKKVGVVSKRYEVKEHRPTRYMVRKLKTFADVLRGEVEALPAPKDVRRMYAEKGVFEARGRFLMIPTEAAGQKQQISRGLVEVVQPLRMGEKARVVLPFHATDMERVADRLENDPTLEGMKRPNELFGFRLFGHNMTTIGFPSAEELAAYIKTHYAHLFSGKNGREGVKHLELIRFRSRSSQLPPAPEDGKLYNRHGRKRPKRERDFAHEKRLERDAKRKEKARERESSQQYHKRLDYQKAYQAQYRQKKFLGD